MELYSPDVMERDHSAFAEDKLTYAVSEGKAYRDATDPPVPYGRGLGPFIDGCFNPIKHGHRTKSSDLPQSSDWPTALPIVEGRGLESSPVPFCADHIPAEVPGSSGPFPHMVAGFVACNKFPALRANYRAE